MTGEIPTPFDHWRPALRVVMQKVWRGLSEAERERVTALRGERDEEGCPRWDFSILPDEDDDAVCIVWLTGVDRDGSRVDNPLDERKWVRLGEFFAEEVNRPMRDAYARSAEFDPEVIVLDEHGRRMETIEFRRPEPPQV
jgi:hypothetical protein